MADFAGAPIPGLVLAIFVLSGAAGLIYEVVWSRQLVLVFGNTTQAVSTILTGSSAGWRSARSSAGGSPIASGRRFVSTACSSWSWSSSSSLTPADVPAPPRGLSRHLPSLEDQPGLLALVRFVLAVLALSPATILMGATLPALTRHLTRDAAPDRRAFGRLYAANTLGAIVGTLRRGPRPDRAVRAERHAADRCGMLGTAGLVALCAEPAARPAPVDAEPPLSRPRRGPTDGRRPRVAPSPGWPCRRIRLGPDLARLPGHSGPGCSSRGPAT